MKVRDVLRLIGEDGWYQVTQKGSHRQFKHPVKMGRVTVAGHPSQEMDKGTLSNITQTGGIEMKEYAAVFEKTSNGWSAYAPDLPGLGVAAATFAETERLLREGIELHIEGMREDGLSIPEPSTRVMRVPISA
jgi:predicted RNA binding protein YcfA (HicA-like mRNA interferase family)/predicted RNase H-like HicB family nuclease